MDDHDERILKIERDLARAFCRGDYAEAGRLRWDLALLYRRLGRRTEFIDAANHALIDFANARDHTAQLEILLVLRQLPPESLSLRQSAWLELGHFYATLSWSHSDDAVLAARRGLETLIARASDIDPRLADYIRIYIEWFCLNPKAAEFAWTCAAKFSSEDSDPDYRFNSPSLLVTTLECAIDVSDLAIARRVAARIKVPGFRDQFSEQQKASSRFCLAVLDYIDRPTAKSLSVLLNDRANLQSRSRFLWLVKLAALEYCVALDDEPLSESRFRDQIRAWSCIPRAFYLRFDLRTAIAIFALNRLRIAYCLPTIPFIWGITRGRSRSSRSVSVDEAARMHNFADRAIRALERFAARMDRRLTTTFHNQRAAEIRAVFNAMVPDARSGSDPRGDLEAC